MQGTALLACAEGGGQIGQKRTEQRNKSKDWLIPFHPILPVCTSLFFLCSSSRHFVSFHIRPGGRQLRPDGTLNAADASVAESSWCLLLTLLQVLVGQWCDSCNLEKRIFFNSKLVSTRGRGEDNMKSPKN